MKAAEPAAPPMAAPAGDHADSKAGVSDTILIRLQIKNSKWITLTS